MENSEKENFLVDVGINCKNVDKNKTTKRVEIKKSKNKNNNDINLLESENDYILIRNEKPQIKANIFKKINIKNTNKNKNIIRNENEKLIKNITNEKIICYNNINKNKTKIKKVNYYYKNKRNGIIKYFILIILLVYTNSLLNFEINKNHNIFNAYEIKIKVKGTGEKYILGDSSYYGYTRPSNIYLNNQLIDRENQISYRKMKINDENIEIKLVWNSEFIYTTKGMFCSCSEITEVDLINFDTSLVTDMSYMFEYYSSLKYLNVKNLDTTKVKLFVIITLIKIRLKLKK